jgi:peroxiredoxin
VKSIAQAVSGPAGEKSRANTFSATGRPCRESVVLVVLRGYTGYQCPLCSRQFGEFLGKADDFKAAGAQVVFIYPGPADKLTQYAGDFFKGKDYPLHFTVLLDPDYAFTNAYGLRWDAKNETAYPTTLVLDAKRTVTFAKISKTHAGRSTAADVLAALAAK